MNVKAFVERKIELTWGMVWAGICSTLAMAAGIIGLVWTVSEWRAVNDLRVMQQAEAVAAMREEVTDLRDAVASIQSDARNDRRILLRLETKLDNLPQRVGSASFPR